MLEHVYNIINYSKLKSKNYVFKCYHKFKKFHNLIKNYVY